MKKRKEKRRTVKVILKSTIGHKFINQEPFSSRTAPPNQRHQVPVVDSANNVNFRLKLPLALPAIHFQAFYGYFLPVGQHPLVHVTEPPLPQKIFPRETARRRRQIFVREAALVESHGHAGVRWWHWLPGKPRRAHLAAAHHRRRWRWWPPPVFAAHPMRRHFHH